MSLINCIGCEANMNNPTGFGSGIHTICTTHFIRKNIIYILLIHPCCICRLVRDAFLLFRCRSLTMRPAKPFAYRIIKKCNNNNNSIATTITNIASNRESTTMIVWSGIIEKKNQCDFPSRCSAHFEDFVGLRTLFVFAMYVGSLLSQFFTSISLESFSAE